MGGKDGGGDIDIATSFPADASTPYVTIVSLAAANISSAVSSDKGDHFALSPAVADVPADDRQWIEAQGDAVVYQMYRAPIPATGLWVQRSTDHGVNWGTASLVSPTGTSPGYIDVDHASGVIYVNLAGYHVKSLRSALAGRGSGVFVTSLYGSASVAGYVMGWIATHGGWAAAGTIQLSLLSLIAAVLALALRPDQMSV